MKKLLLAAAVATLGFAAAPVAMAQTAPNGTGSTASACSASPCTDADMAVHVAIQGNCSAIEVGDLEFGTHPQLTGTGTANRDAVTQVDVLCVTGAGYTVELDYGLNSTATNQRQVIDGGTNNINYGLFKDAGRTQPWGTEANEPGSSQAGTGAGTSYVSTTVYGRLTQTSQDPAGDYTDLVTATLNF